LAQFSHVTDRQTDVPRYTFSDRNRLLKRGVTVLPVKLFCLLL